MRTFVYDEPIFIKIGDNSSYIGNKQISMDEDTVIKLMKALAQKEVLPHKYKELTDAELIQEFCTVHFAWEEKK